MTKEEARLLKQIDELSASIDELEIAFKGLQEHCANLLKENEDALEAQAIYWEGELRDLQGKKS